MTTPAKHLSQTQIELIAVAAAATEEQLKAAQELIARALPNQPSFAGSPELLAGVVQALATNYHAMASAIIAKDK
jgi:hypothetical protein